MDDRNVLIIMCVAMCLACLVSIVLFLEYWWLYEDYIRALTVMSTKCICYQYDITNFTMPLITP